MPKKKSKKTLVKSANRRVRLYSESRKKYFTSVRNERAIKPYKLNKRNPAAIDKFFDKEVRAQFAAFHKNHKKKSKLFQVRVSYQFGKAKSGFSLPRTKITRAAQVDQFLALLVTDFKESMKGYLKSRGMQSASFTGVQFEAIEDSSKKFKNFDWRKQKKKLASKHKKSRLKKVKRKGVSTKKNKRR